MENLHGVAMFTNIDLRSEYHQIRVRKCDQFKTAFKTHHVHCELQGYLLSFGITNEPVTFQIKMNIIFKTYLRIKKLKWSHSL